MTQPRVQPAQPLHPYFASMLEGAEAAGLDRYDSPAAGATLIAPELAGRPSGITAGRTWRHGWRRGTRSARRSGPGW
jgi:hypothetical protein